jgi:hypothetical protein
MSGTRSQRVQQPNVFEILRPRVDLFGQNQIVQDRQQHRDIVAKANRSSPRPQRVELHRSAVDGRHRSRDQTSTRSSFSSAYRPARRASSGERVGSRPNGSQAALNGAMSSIASQ